MGGGVTGGQLVEKKPGFFKTTTKTATIGQSGVMGRSKGNG
jgi:hypothetical protein